MRKFITRRIILMPITFIGITFILFFIINLLPATTLAISYSTSDKELTSKEIDEIIQKYSLDKPIYLRYIKWFNRLLKGELGYSQSAKMNVSTAIKTYLPATIELAIFAIIPIFLLGSKLGIKAAINQNSIIDKSIRFFSTFFYSMPGFIIGIMILLIFYGVFGILEPQRYSNNTNILILSGKFTRYTNFMLIDSMLNLNFSVFIDCIKHLFMPALSIFLGTCAVFIKITRTSMLEELNKDYVKALRAKGIDEKRIINFHVRKNILIPQITIGGLQMIRLLSGVVITETIFDWPGIGSFGVKAATQLDIAGTMGFAIVISTLFIVGNFIIDILYSIVDPRIRYE